MDGSTQKHEALAPEETRTLLKRARESGLGVARCYDRLNQRIAAWCTDLSWAREGGASPVQLQAQIEEVSADAGIPLDQLPVDVWRAAGMKP